MSAKRHAADAGTGGIDAALLTQEVAAKAGINIGIVREPIDGCWSDVWMRKDFSVCYRSGRATGDRMFPVGHAEGAAWADTFRKHEKFNQLLRAGAR